jgi:hypothetical protein
MSDLPERLQIARLEIGGFCGAIKSTGGTEYVRADVHTAALARAEAAEAKNGAFEVIESLWSRAAITLYGNDGKHFVCRSAKPSEPPSYGEYGNGKTMFESLQNLKDKLDAIDAKRAKLEGK